MDSTPASPLPTDPSHSPSSLSVESLWGGLGRSSASPVSDPLVGRTLGNVRLVRMIAEGGMGRVYEGLQEKPARTVAVKVLRPGIASREAVRRFMNEAEILGRLRHPAIAQIYAAGTFAVLDTEVFYIVMEYVADAVTITQYMRANRPAIGDRMAILATVIDAVAHGHGRGVIHRDLKPGNILVDAEGQAKVIDFGVAREVARDDGDSLTRSGQVLGTLPWMSPEQIDSGAEHLDARSDVYSLGVVLYEALTDEVPYDLRDKTLIESATIIREGRPPSPHVVTRAVPLAVSRVVERCLAKDPSDRFPNAADLLAALAAAQRQPSEPRRMAALGMMLFAAASAIGIVVWSASWLPGVVAGTRSPEGSLRVVTAVGAEYGFDVIDEADPYLIEAKGVRLFRDGQQPSTVYWGPDTNDGEGMLVYRFPFPRPTRSVRIFARAYCFDFSKDPGGVGRGAAAIEVSRDGVEWHAVRNGIEPPSWGVDQVIDEPLPAAACGTTTVWVRVRMRVEHDSGEEHPTAQFGKGTTDRKMSVFAVTASELDGPDRRWAFLPSNITPSLPAAGR